jgi:phosphoadenosine phosphosulfate reductase
MDESGTTIAPATWEELARSLEGVPTREVLQWAVRTYRPRVALACSFGGPTGIVALDMIMSIDRATPVYVLDTGLLFPETHALIDRIKERYGIEPIRISPALSVREQECRYGPKLWERDPDACCAMRKVEPQKKFLEKYDAWISGVRRDQAETRAEFPIVQWDKQFRLVKINAFATWDERTVWAYIREHDLPYNELHDHGFPSIGCVPCTRAVQPGEEGRAGRWPGHDKTECGIHIGATPPFTRHAS